MEKRIDSAEKDIREHFKLHKNCLDCFMEMDSAIIVDDRELFSGSCIEMCESVFTYLELAEEHQQKFKDESFLHYPYCSPGHYFHILNYRKISPCKFNETTS